MEWDKLLSEKRFRQSDVRSSQDGRNEFENDYARIVFSSSFRRLQDKAQVFPCDPNDFVRTRLTHSIEVAAIGRSIGISVENILKSKANYDNEQHRGKISSILATAGLIHDLGNPPFGHHGEIAFQDFYKNLISAMDPSKKIQILSDQERADFEFFDGNVQTFRILKRLQYLTDEHSFNLTYPVLATIIKYPKSSIDGNKKKSENICDKKFGFFFSEKKFFDEIWDTLEIKDTKKNNSRHPLTYLLEASDDIAYSIADLEDGTKKGIINYDDLLHELEKVAKFDTVNKNINEDFYNSAKDIQEKIEEDKNLPNKSEVAIQRLRIKAQTLMTIAVLKEFEANYDSILAGEYNKDLLESSQAGDIRRLLKKMASKIFAYKPILKQEIMGGKVLSFLLEEFVTAALSERRDQIKTKEGKIYKLISDNYKYIKQFYPSQNPNSSIYNRLLLVNDFISGMTDNYALSLYKELNGIS